MMQSVKSLVKARHSVQRLGFLSSSSSSHQRSYFVQPNYDIYDFQEEVLVEGRAKARAAVLNRPSSLNALNNHMVDRLKKLYKSWEEDPDIGFILMKGNGRAFCSGFDAVTLYQSLNEGKVEECKSFFESLQKFVYLQGTYLKPHVAILDGITMGCGGGISLAGMFRLVTDRTVFASPETLLGFHPHAGASFYLSRLPGYLGEYLALTGEKLNGVEMIACGLATHYCLHDRLPLIEERLGNLMNDDPTVIESSLAKYGDLVYPESKSVLNSLDVIDRIFSHDTVEEIIASLEGEAHGHGFHGINLKSAVGKIKGASPLSLKVTLQSIRQGRFQSLDACLAREYRMSLAGISKRVSNDFSEGVRARFVDKDFAPKWDPPMLEDVSEDMVNYYFSPLEESEPELVLPIALREPYI